MTPEQKAIIMAQVFGGKGGGGGEGTGVISGAGAPTQQTAGKINQFYRDTQTDNVYICSAANTSAGTYEWSPVSARVQNGTLYI